MTVSVVIVLTPFSAAVIVEVPWPTPAASPPLLIVATDGALEDQLTWLVRSCVLLSEKVPVALNCWVDPAVIEAFAGLKPMATSVGDTAVTV